MAEYFCNSVGILQQCAPPGQFGGFEKAQSKPPAVQNEGTSKFYKQKLFIETLVLQVIFIWQRYYIQVADLFSTP